MNTDTPTPRTDDYEAYSEWLHKHMTKKGRTHGQIESLMTSGTGLLLFEVWEAAIEKSQRELANAMASASTYREQYEASEMNIKNLMHYVKGLPHHVSISSPAIPIRDALILLHIDKADIETKWEELCIAVGAHGPESDPLLGTDTNDDIHKRGMEKIRELTAVTEQRDRLAEALKEYREALSNGPENCSYKMYEAVDEFAEKALAAVKGGSDE